VSQEPGQNHDQSSDDDGPMTVRDDQLPGDLQPSEDNPLARPADDDAPDDLLKQEAARANSGRGSEDAATGDDDASGTSSSAASPETGSSGSESTGHGSPDADDASQA
jgi:hypothetical protein